MKVSQEKVEENKVALDVEVDAEEVDNALDQAYQKIVKDVDIDGFRKGKVPRGVLEAKYGKEVLHKDALDIIISKAYREAVEETEIEPIAQPEIIDVFIEEGKPATFTAEVEVKPEVELGEYTGLDIEQEVKDITEDDVMDELNRRRERFAELKVSEREEVAEGDFAIIDFDGYLDGEPFEGGSGEEYTLEIGSGTFIPGFEEQLIGVKVGEEVEVDVTFPENYQSEELAGEGVIFKVKVKEIKEKVLPELDDELAQELGDFETLDELKEDIRTNLKEDAEAKIENKFINDLIETVADNAEVNIPEAMVEDELDTMMNGMRQRLQQQGMDFEQYLEMTGSEEEAFRAQHRPDAEKRVKSNLTLEAIAEKEGIEVTEEEIENKIEEIAEQQDQEPDMIKALLQMQGQYDSIVNSIQMQKTIDFLTDNN
ncbi:MULTISPECIES: trigger factor [unclassified Candidatus Frackibacter]|uniref:trigger factor n=1 Tax=unclassified Candidatus Frackibacter TaxID=2648818 RepID=UPI0008822E30|nr:MULTISPECIES: trigger factor [unclassified Candidatus Frackibacter]SDC75827.1 trigger factor [Candidatus Frackibacter sp. WG11]SEM89430.1 trigger factor [Candidatus Frackibacter sp. WG12]SFL98893.1 trigger factor [Candidatus Frackibacter sp. WG13]